MMDSNSSIEKRSNFELQASGLKPGILHTFNVYVLPIILNPFHNGVGNMLNGATEKNLGS